MRFLEEKRGLGGRKTPPFAGAKRRGRNREEADKIGWRISSFSFFVNSFFPVQTFFSAFSIFSPTA
jgi:hypothetical protein